MMRKISKAFILGCVAAAIHVASTQGWASSSASGGAPLPIDPCTGQQLESPCGAQETKSCSIMFPYHKDSSTKALQTRIAGASELASECTADPENCKSNDRFPANLGCTKPK